MASNFIDDEYEHPDSSIEYVMENVLSEAASNENDEVSKTLREDYNSVLMNFCLCDNLCDIHNCIHGNNYNEQRGENNLELVLKHDLKKDLIYECSPGCRCNNKCRNRLVQYGPRKHLKIVYSPLFKSQGLITLVAVPRGAFICEYAGELITLMEACQRIKKNEELCKMNYIIFLNEIQEERENLQKHLTIVDPAERGNIGRYLNHSCEPNCEIFSVRVDCPVPKICIFSKREINAGEELCFHYGGGLPSNEEGSDIRNRIKCLCGAKLCEKFLPNIKF